MTKFRSKARLLQNWEEVSGVWSDSAAERFQVEGLQPILEGFEKIETEIDRYEELLAEHATKMSYKNWVGR